MKYFMSLSSIYPTVKLLGVNIFGLRMDEVVTIANEHITGRKRLLIAVVNVAKFVNMRKDLELRRSLEEADLVLADGAPVVWLSRMLRKPLPERVAGIDLMFKLLKEANDKHHSVYFLGARPEVLQKVVNIIQTDYPGIRIAGFRDGYFDKDREQSVAQDIKDSRADIIFVAISPPKKEIFLRKWRDFMNVPVCHGVGGSFDVLAGVTRRAPRWMRKFGMEWLYRLIQEPRRMWKRYLVTNSIFIKLSCEAILRDRFGRLLRRFRVTPAPNPKK